MMVLFLYEKAHTNNINLNLAKKIRNLRFFRHAETKLNSCTQNVKGHVRINILS